MFIIHCSGSRSPENAEFVISRYVLQMTVKKRTTIYNVRAKPLFCLLNISFVLIAVVVVVCVNSLVTNSSPVFLATF